MLLRQWADYLKIKWSVIKHDLGDLEIFGENLFAVHSLKYVSLEDHFYVFGVRLHDTWLSWDETKFYAALLDFKTVPELLIVNPIDKNTYESQILDIVKGPSTYESMEKNEAAIYMPCRMEGIVSRNIEEYKVREFKMNVFKYVRKDHVKTDKHWSKAPRRATLLHERPLGQDPKLDNDKIIK